MAPWHPALEQDRRAPHQRLPHAHRLAHRPRRHPPPLRRNGRARLLRRRRPAIDAQFRSPHDIAQDKHGNIVINDISNFVYRRIDAETGIIETIIGSGKKGRGGHGGPATEAEMDTHCGVAIAENGDIFVSSEWTNNVSRVDAETGIIELFAGHEARHHPPKSATASRTSGPVSVSAGTAGTAARRRPRASTTPSTSRSTPQATCTSATTPTTAFARST